MSDSFSSDEDLPDPSDLLDRLLLETPRKGLINNGSINNPLTHRAFDPKLPESLVRTPPKLGEGTGRRSSPRLRNQRGSSTNSLSPSNARASTSKRAESPSFDSERERDIHLELATKLFPPSPAPQPPRSTAPPFLPEQTLRRMSVGSIVEDSDIEAERKESYRIDRNGREKRETQDEISQRNRNDEGRGVREGTVISDSEIEGEERIPASALGTPRRREPRVSATFDLEESEPEDERNAEEVRRRDQERITRDPLVDSLNRLNLATSSIPKPAPSSLSTRSRSRSPTKPSVPSPLPLPTSTKSTRNLDTPRRSTSKRIGQKSARGKRRITISVISSSSSESSDSSKEDETEEGILRRSTPPRLDRKDPAPARGTRRNGLGGRVTTGVDEEEGEIVMVETDDEEETGIQGGGRDGGEEEILPVLEPFVKLTGVQGIGEEGGGYGYKGMDDVWENDGVLIYDPTPKKRPAKLSSTLSKPSPSPFLHAHPTSTPVPRNRALTPSKLRKEETIDLTLSPTKRDHSKPSHRSKPGSPALSSTPRNETSSGKKPQQANKRVEIDLTESSSEEEEAARDKDAYYLPPPSKFFPAPGPKTPRAAPTTTKSRSTSPSKCSIPAPPARTPRTPNPKPKPKDTPRPTPSSSSSALLTPSDRTSLPLSLIRQLDKQVFRKTWVTDLECLDQRHEDEKEGEGVKGLPQGLEVVWNARLRNTAGRAKWKKVKSPNPNGSMTLRHVCTIELATKVTDTVEKLRNTLAHELCHIAAWVLSGEIKPPHGNAFKLWATRIMKVCPDIKVTTTHSYEIVYKYRWKCSSTVCGKIFGRHSNSINVETHGCPCGSKLSQIDKDGNVKKPMIPKMILQENERGEMVETPVRRKKSDWLEFVATQSPRVRKEKPEIPQSEVLKVVAERWKVAKEELARAKLRELEKDKDKALKDNRDGNDLERAMSGLKV